MEFWTISGDGNGNYIIYPTALLGTGIILFAVLGIIKSIVEGSVNLIYDFANAHTDIVLLFFAIFALILCILICVLWGKKYIISGISIACSTFMMLSLCYSVIIYYVAEFIEELSEVFIVALIMSPVFLILMLVQLAVTFAPILLLLIPFYLEDYNKYKVLISVLLFIVVVVFYVVFLYKSEVIQYLQSSI